MKTRIGRLGRGSAVVLAIVAGVATASLPRSGVAGGPGGATANILKVSPGGRAAGMGEAGSALSDEPYSVHFNPAGLLMLMDPAYAVSFASWDGTMLNAVYAHPAGEGRVAYAGGFTQFSGTAQEFSAGGVPGV